MKLRYSIFCVIVCLVLGVALTNAGIVYSQDSNTVLEQAKKSLQAKFNSSSSAVVQGPPVFQVIKGSSTVKDVWFTWLIISSDNEISVNLRYVGDGAAPPLGVAAAALTKEGKLMGNTVLNAGWVSPNTVQIAMNGESSLYDAWSINVVASAVGSSPPSPPELPSQEPSPPRQEPPTVSNNVPVPAEKPQINTPTAGTLKVLSSNSFIDKIGVYHVVGEIQNGSPDPVTFVQASGTFYDKNNKVVGTSFGYTRPPDLGPGDKAPFEILLTSSSIPAKLIKNYRVTISHD